MSNLTGTSVTPAAASSTPTVPNPSESLSSSSSSPSTAPASTATTFNLAYTGPLSDGWSTDGLFNACPHICQHVFKPAYKYPERLYWGLNSGSAYLDHVASLKFHEKCFEGCPGYDKFQRGTRDTKGNIPERRPATFPETLRALYVYKKMEREGDISTAIEKKFVEQLNSGSRLVNSRLKDYWAALPNLPPLQPSLYSNGGIGPDPGRLQFQDIPTQLSAAMRPFDVDAAMKGLPAMPGSAVPSPGPVICGYNTGAITAGPQQAPAPVISPAPVPASTAISLPEPDTSLPTFDSPASGSPIHQDRENDESAVPPDEENFISIDLRRSLERLMSAASLSSASSRLPARVLFLLPDGHCSNEPLTSKRRAAQKSLDDHYWCVGEWQMNHSRRRIFWKKYQNDQALRRAMLIHFPAYPKTPKTFMVAEIFTWSWVFFALILYDEGVDVEFMMESNFLKLLQQPDSEAGKEFWNTSVKFFDTIIGGSSLPDFDLSNQEYKSWSALTKCGIKIWPHRLSNDLVLQKTIVYPLLASVIERAGGFAEAVKLVSSVEQGLDLLERGNVIKRDYSDECKHVFFPQMKPFMDYAPGTRFEIDAETKKKFLQAWADNEKKGKHSFLAQKYNSCLLALGEVRVYFVFGKYVDMFHTLPPNEAVGRYGMRYEACYGRLSDITKMVPPENGSFVDWGQQRNFNELWHARDMVEEHTGTHQVQEFARAIYEQIVRVENSVLRGNKDMPGICGLQMFARVDTGLVWDNRDEDLTKHRYRFILNEIQPGDASLFMIDMDCRTNIIRAMVEGIKRGCMEQ